MLIFASPKPLHDSAAVLNPAELSALRMDGVLVPLGTSWRNADSPDTSEARADWLVSQLSNTKLVAAQLTAAWIYQALTDFPFPCQILTSDGNRRGLPRQLHYELGQTVFQPGDLRRVAGLAVTSPERTVLDLARHPEAMSGTIFRVLERLITQFALDPLGLASRVKEAQKYPYKLVAARNLTLLNEMRSTH